MQRHVIRRVHLGNALVVDALVQELFGPLGAIHEELGIGYSFNLGMVEVSIVELVQIDLQALQIVRNTLLLLVRQAVLVVLLQL